ncbi:hypothetical protein MKX03_024070 [Papaver bracteatum]|nr:hypothetical protein MKX03_024070 [Papaver bracteatum]
MEKEPLLCHPWQKPPGMHLRTPSGLSPLPEDEEIIIPSNLPPSSPLTPSEYKDYLIFGPPSPSTTTTINIDALNLADSSSSSLNALEHDIPPPLTTDTATSMTISSSLLSPSTSWLNDPPTKTNKTNLHRSKTAPAMAAINNVDHHDDHLEKPNFGTQPVIRQAVVLLFIYLSLGVVIYSCNRDNFSAIETHPVVDALYFCIVTMCTIGYGDITPTTTSAKLFSIMFVLVGFGFIDILLSGMVSYFLDIQENMILTTVKGGLNTGAGNGDRKHNSRTRRYFIDVKKGRMRIRIKVGLALGVVVICIGIGTGIMHFVEKLGWLDSFYLSVMSVTTVGYGDRAFNSLPGRIFASIWLLVSTLAVARAFLYLAEARVDKRHRTMNKWVLRQDMTVKEFLAADMDQNGYVSKSEYVIYKLKEMNKIAEKDIQQICAQFDRLDEGNCGKITLTNLWENRH